MNKEELKRLQSLSLKEKIDISKMRIVEFYEMNKGNVVVSFSGGADSTALLHLVRTIYPDVKGVYCDTGLEYPEVKAHVKATENIEIIRPKYSFKEVIDRYGWVYPTKEIAMMLHYAKMGKDWAIKRFNGLKNDGTEDFFRQRYKNYAYLIDAPFKFHNDCCRVMKKDPFGKYKRRHNNVGMMIGTRVDESRIRKASYLKVGGCINPKKNNATPIAFWSSQDIMQYILDNNIELAECYGRIEGREGNRRFSGVQRTGCIFCPIAGDNQELKRLHPKLYEYVMETLGLRKLFDWVKEHRPKCQTLYTSQEEFNRRQK